MVKRLESTNLKSNVEDESLNWGAVTSVIVFFIFFCIFCLQQEQKNVNVNLGDKQLMLKEKQTIPSNKQLTSKEKVHIPNNEQLIPKGKSKAVKEKQFTSKVKPMIVEFKEVNTVQNENQSIADNEQTNKPKKINLLEEGFTAEEIKILTNIVNAINQHELEVQSNEAD